MGANKRISRFVDCLTEEYNLNNKIVLEFTSVLEWKSSEISTLWT